MLLDGQIDLLAGLAKTEERLGVVGYPEFPMGSEIYNMVKHSEDDRITTSYSTLNGKKIGEASLAEAYEAIKELAASFDYDSIQLILEELAGSRIPKEKAARHTRLAEAAKKPDWDELKKVLAEE